MKEKRKGPIGRAAGIAEGLAATVRRMQREREPRVLVYDETGYARLVQPDGRGYERLLETAERMVALVDESETAAKAKPRRVTAGGDADTGDAPPAKPRRAKTATKGKAGSAGKAAAKPRRARQPKAVREGERGRGKGTAKSRRTKAGGADGGKRRAPRKDDA